MRFKIFDVNFRISVPFTVILAFLLIVDQTGLMTASVFAVLVHEFGHIFMMRHLKCLPREVDFTIGGILICGTAFCTFKENIKIALSGPFANGAAFVLFYSLGLLFKYEILLAFAAVQLVEGAVNLFPVKGLDGGTAFKILVNSLNIRHKELSVNVVSFVTSIMILILGTAVAVKNVSNPSLLLLGIYLIILNVVKLK